MNNLKSGPISSNDLMTGLAKARKLMNKVDTGDYQKGFIDESTIVEGSDYSGKEFTMSDPDGLIDIPQEKTRFKVIGETSEEKIQNSRLPDAIKNAMIKTPIPQISLNDTIDMEFVKGAKRIMENEGMITRPKTQSKQVTSSNPEMVNILTPIIENIVRKTVTEILDKKLDQLLTAQKTMSINENLVIKAGNSVFTGKITGVKSGK